MTIYITEPDDIDGESVALLRQHGHLVISEEREASLRATEIGALFVRTYTQVDTVYLDRYPAVKFVLRAGVGLDNIDTVECKKRDIVVINAPGANANAVAEYVVGAVIFLLRMFGEQSMSLRAGGWRERVHIGTELKGKTLGLVGCGAIGQLIAHKLSCWELRECIGYDPYLTEEQLRAAGIRKVGLAEIWEQSNIISLHLPLIPETRHSIGAAEFACMKKGTLLVNAARGGIVDESALIIALQNGTLRGAVLDVFEYEPTVPAEFLTLPNVLLTPHIAGYTAEADKEVSLAPVRELLRRIEGQ